MLRLICVMHSKQRNFDEERVTAVACCNQCDVVLKEDMPELRRFLGNRE
jgi:hypothetical protein